MTEYYGPNSPEYYLESDSERRTSNMEGFAASARPPFDPEDRAFQLAFERFGAEFIDEKLKNGGIAVTQYLGIIAESWVRECMAEMEKNQAE